MPAKAGIQSNRWRLLQAWVLAFARMTWDFGNTVNTLERFMVKLFSKGF